MPSHTQATPLLFGARPVGFRAAMGSSPSASAMGRTRALDDAIQFRDALCKGLPARKNSLAYGGAKAEKPGARPEKVAKTHLAGKRMRGGSGAGRYERRRAATRRKASHSANM